MRNNCSNIGKPLEMEIQKCDPACRALLRCVWRRGAGTGRSEEQAEKCLPSSGGFGLRTLGDNQPHGADTPKVCITGEGGNEK